MDQEIHNKVNEEVIEKLVSPEPEVGNMPQANSKMAYVQFLLPGAILFAALIISATLFYTRGGGTAQIGGTGQEKKVEIKIGPNDHILGDKNAKISIVEFADFRCPFCEKFFQQSESQLIKEYVDTGKAKFVFKNYAFLGPQSTWASEAAECAGEQGKFWEYHDWLYANQAPESNLNYYSKNNLIKYAGNVGLDAAQFASCLNSDSTAARVADDLAQGQAAGVTGTPTVFINGQKIVGAQPYVNFQTVIDSFLKK